MWFLLNLLPLLGRLCFLCYTWCSRFLRCRLSGCWCSSSSSRLRSSCRSCSLCWCCWFCLRGSFLLGWLTLLLATFLLLWLLSCSRLSWGLGLSCLGSWGWLFCSWFLSSSSSSSLCWGWLSCCSSLCTCSSSFPSFSTADSGSWDFFTSRSWLFCLNKK